MSENKNKGISSARTSEIWLTDLWHQQQSSRYFPLGIGYVAAYAQKIFGDRFSFRLFTNPDKFIRQCNEGTPLLVGMRNDLTKSRLNYEMIVRLKKIHPDTVTVMGGPNYPLEPEKQAEYLKARPLLDFYVFKDGEIPFAELLKHLLEFHFDAAELKRSRIEIPGVHYLCRGLSATNPPAASPLIAGKVPARPPLLDEFPSPYTTGLLDPFFEEDLAPVIQTVRGCPFACTYCTEGERYFNGRLKNEISEQRGDSDSSFRLKVRRFSRDRVKAELDWITGKSGKVDLLFVADSNFGMYEEDIETADLIADFQKNKGWPKKICFSAGKNKKNTVLAALHRFLPGTALYIASLQSTDPVVLENVRRKNVSVSSLILLCTEAEKYGWFSFTELILGMPGETVSSHLKSLRKVIELGIRVVNVYPVAVLLGSEMDTAEYRRRFQIKPYFTFLPNCVGQYPSGSERVLIAEISEMGVVHSTMSLEDYLDCRMMNFSVAMFYSHGCFYEAESLLKHLNLPVFDFIERCHRLVSDSAISDNVLSRLYAEIRAYNRKTLFETREQAEKFFTDPVNIKEYVEAEYKLYFENAYRIGILLYGEPTHHIARKALTDQLEAANMLTEDLQAYIAELFRFSLHRKKDILNAELVFEDEFSFDFAELYRLKFQADPMDFLRAEKQRLRFAHSPQTAAEIKGVFGWSPDINKIVHQRWTAKPLTLFFREVEVAE
jgi:radical SAM superfamily enzyme YgiQ (UPF0313 family)